MATDTFTTIALTLAQQIRGTDTSALLQAARQQLDGRAAGEFLTWLDQHPEHSDPALVRAVQYVSLTSQPITTEPNVTHYAWAGATLQRLLGSPRPIAETWSFFSGPQKPALIAGTACGALLPITMEELVRHMPEVLGPVGADPENGGQKYFFVKWLDPSDFPAFAYVGFHPDAVGRVGRPPERFRAYFADLLWQDREAVETCAQWLRPHITTEAQFQQLQTAYKQWAITQAAADWQGPIAADALMAGAPAGRETASMITALLTRMQEIRRQITQLMHRIDFADDQAILIETPTLHAIAGLSLQIHPKVPGNFHPKDELWIYKTVEDAQGRRIGWVLIEPQRTFDTTESGGDFFTPFAWKEGRLDFRKPITRAYLQSFVALMDATPHPRAHYVRTAQPATLPEHTMQGNARWYRTVDETTWPYFLVRELRFTGAGQTELPLPHHSFQELHVTHGTVRLTLTRRDGARLERRITPATPVFLPASLPYDTLQLAAAAPAQLQHFMRRPPA